MSRDGARAALLVPRRHWFLSPHFDDIALSCGGTATLLARHGCRPEVVVIFGGVPEATAPLSAFAKFQHTRWGLQTGAAVAARRAEEARAAALLGVHVETLPLLDAIYRGERYRDDDQLFGEPTADEVNLPGQIAAALEFDDGDAAGTRIYAPLAVGGHVDHRHVFRAGVNLARRGWDVWFYEDQPYALDRDVVAKRVASLARQAGALEVAAAVDVSETWAVKMAAVMAYRSQVPVIFRHVAPGGKPAAVAAAMTAAAADGRGRPVERYWRCGR